MQSEERAALTRDLQKRFGSWTMMNQDLSKLGLDQVGLDASLPWPGHAWCRGQPRSHGVSHGPTVVSGSRPQYQAVTPLLQGPAAYCDLHITTSQHLQSSCIGLGTSLARLDRVCGCSLFRHLQPSWAGLGTSCRLRELETHGSERSIAGTCSHHRRRWARRRPSRERRRQPPG